MGILPLALALAPSLCAQNPPDSRPGEVRGIVRDARSNDQLRKAQLVLAAAGESTQQQQTRRVVLTIGDGRFHFSAVPPGRYRLIASRSGYVTHTLPRILEVKPGQQLDAIEVPLTPQSVIAGKVRDIDGDTVEKALVAALRVSYASGVRTLRQAASVYTNDLGEYRISGLTAGRYYLVAARGVPRDTVLEAMAEDYVPTYYPNAATASMATPIDLAPGQDALALIVELRRLPLFRVSGKVAGLSAGTVNLVLLPDDPELARGGSAIEEVVQPKPDGSYLFPAVPPGSYVVVAIRNQERPVTLARRLLRVALGPVDDFAITLAEPVRVEGRVRVDGPATIDFSSLHVVLAGAGTHANPIDAPVNADGHFDMKAISREPHRLILGRRPENTYLKSVRLANAEVPPSAVDLSYSGATAPLEIVLGANPASIEGIVFDQGMPAANRAVTLIPDPQTPDRAHLLNRVNTDERGVFRFLGLAPGDYRIHAWHEIQSELFADPAYMSKLPGRRVSLKEGGIERVEITEVLAEPEL